MKEIPGSKKILTSATTGGIINIIEKEKLMSKTLTIENRKGETFTILIDQDDYEKVSQYKWYVNWDGKRETRYVVTNVLHPDGGTYSKGTKSENVKKRAKLLLHRFIMDTPAGMHTDHINGNPFDNRKENLRILTQTEHKKIGATYNEGSLVS